MARNTTPKQQRQWWSTVEVAEELGTAPTTVRDWARDPELIRMGAVRRAGRFLRLHWPKLQEWLDQRTLDGAPAVARDDWAWQPGKPGRPPKWAQRGVAG